MRWWGGWVVVVVEMMFCRCLFVLTWFFQWDLPTSMFVFVRWQSWNQEHDTPSARRWWAWSTKTLENMVLFQREKAEANVVDEYQHHASKQCAKQNQNLVRHQQKVNRNRNFKSQFDLNLNLNLNFNLNLNLNLNLNSIRFLLYFLFLSLL